MVTVDVSDVITSGDMAESYTILRSTGSFQAGGWQETKTEIDGFGVVTVATDRDLRMVPEGDRVEGAMVFYSVQPIYETHAGNGAYGPLPNGDPGAGTSDILQWHKQNYRVARISPRSNRGFWKAIAVRMAGQ